MAEETEKKNWLEWTVTIISTILVAFTLGFLVYQLIFEEQNPPNLVVTVGEISAKDGAFALPILVKNEGTQTAENIVVEIVSGDGSLQEKAQITFQYLPGKSSVNGWVTFIRKPNLGTLKRHVLGYAIP